MDYRKLNRIKKGPGIRIRGPNDLISRTLKYHHDWVNVVKYERSVEVREWNES